MILASFFEVPTLSDLLKLAPQLKLIIFDMDGTLVDTEQEHAQSIVNLLKMICHQSIDEKQVHNIVFGRPDPYAFEVLQKTYSLKLSLQEFLEKKHVELESILEKNLHPRKVKTFSLIEELKTHKANLKWTVVTASERRTAQSVLTQKFPGFFDHYFGREDTLRSKPFPEPYWNAIKVMQSENLSKEEILILEDSPTGLASALASGYNVIRAYWYTYKS